MTTRFTRGRFKLVPRIHGISNDSKTTARKNVVSSLKIPDYDRTQRLYELDKLYFEINPHKSENFTLIEITMFSGRSKEAKKNLYQNIVKNLNNNPGIIGTDIMIVIHEPPLHNWGIGGGKPADELNLELFL